MPKAIWQFIASIILAVVLAFMAALIPIFWIKVGLWISIPLLVWSLWQGYKWPFVKRYYLKLRERLRFYIRFMKILITQRKVVHLVHFEGQTSRIVKAKTLHDLQVEIEQLKAEVQLWRKNSH